MNIFLSIGYVSMLTALTSFVFGFIKRKSLNQVLYSVVWLFLASVLADLVSLVLIPFRINNLLIGYGFMIYQYTILFQLYHRENPNQTLTISFIGSILFGIINLIFIQTPQIFNSFTFYVSALVLVISGINYLYYLVTKLPVEDVKTHPMLWITFGTIVYYAGTTFIFLFSNYLISYSLEDHQKIWVLHNLLSITKNIMFFIALWVNYKSKTSSS